MNNELSIGDLWPLPFPDMEPGTGGCEEIDRILEDTIRSEGIGELPAVPEDSTGDMDDEWTKHFDPVVRRLAENKWADSSYYLSDVYACKSADEATRLGKELDDRAGTFKRDLLIISVHGDHVHSAHNCAFSNGQCKCRFNKFPQAKEQLRGRIRRPRSTQTFQYEDWYNVVKYFSTDQHFCTTLKVCGADRRLSAKDIFVRQPETSGNRSKRSLEACRGDDQCDDPGEPYNIKRCRQDYGKESGIPLTSKKTIKGLPGKILGILNKTAIRPLIEIVNAPHYLDHGDLELKRENDKDVQNCISARKARMIHWTLADYKKFYEDPEVKLLWGALNFDHFKEYYYDYDESVEITKDFLKFQFDNNEDVIIQFCTELLNILERKVRKRNCMTIVSEHTSGKNWFFDSIFDYYMNTGMVQNSNRYSTFPFMDIAGARIGFWNEPNYEPKVVEELKNLFEGKSFPAAVKYQGHRGLRLCPIIVMSNREPTYARMPEFSNRIYLWRFKQNPNLRDKDMYPRPDSVMDVILYYNK